MSKQSKPTSIPTNGHTDPSKIIKAHARTLRFIKGEHDPERFGPYSQAVALQDLILHDAFNPNTKPSIRAGLIRAWDILEERKRILRGRPLPGQLRPDLDPVQLSRALHRQKQRLITDVSAESFSGPRELGAKESTKTARSTKDQCPETGQKPGDEMPATNHPETCCHKESLYGMDPSPPPGPDGDSE